MTLVQFVGALILAVLIYVVFSMVMTFPSWIIGRGVGMRRGYELTPRPSFLMIRVVRYLIWLVGSGVAVSGIELLMVNHLGGGLSMLVVGSVAAHYGAYWVGAIAGADRTGHHRQVAMPPVAPAPPFGTEPLPQQVADQHVRGPRPYPDVASRADAEAAAEAEGYTRAVPHDEDD